MLTFGEYSKGLFDAEVTRAIFWGLGFFSFDDFYDDGDLRMTLECVVQMLLNHSLDVNVINHEGQPLLHYTTRGGHSRVVQLLLDHGVSYDEGRREDPRSLAAVNGHEDVVQLLLDHGADDNAH